MNFRELHDQEEPLLICNVWDAASAAIAEKSGFQAAGTSSAAIATMLGYPDGEQMTFEELLFMVKRIAVNCSLPLTVDLESGYSRDPQVIADHISQLAALGVDGINLEDSVVADQRQLLDAEVFAATIAEVNSQLTQKNIDMFLNIRTDTFLLGSPTPVEKTIERILHYQAAGADGIFVPGIEKAEDIQRVVQSTTLPVNVMCMPNLPDFATLQSLGVKRISMGNFLFDFMLTQLNTSLRQIKDKQSFSMIF